MQQFRIKFILDSITDIFSNVSVFSLGLNAAKQTSLSIPHLNALTLAKLTTTEMVTALRGVLV